MILKTTSFRSFVIFFISAFNIFFCGLAHSAPNYVWIEGESPASITPSGIKPTIESVGRPDYLSGGNWLKVDVSADQVDSVVPASGIVLTYNFSLSSASTYQVWDRVGYENVRSDFDWRIDEGNWTTAKTTDHSTDVEELQTWNPIGWLNIGTASLTAGAHVLQIRINKHADDKGKAAELLYASDAICIYDGTFRPNDQYKPGDISWMTDQDRSAESNIFKAVVPTDSTQSSTSLSGLWQIARDDEPVVSDPSGPTAIQPSADSLYWKSMAVPGDRDSALPQWIYNHRYWLRTKVDIPQELAGKSFFIHFPAISMTATVFVNGQMCGFNDTPFAAWDCDITKAIKPGQTNNIWVGIKDWFYALPDQGAKNGGHIEYIPTDWVTKYGPANFTFPVWNHTENGILRPPTLIAAGPVYTSDIFAKPSVTNKTLGLEVTLTNPSNEQQTVSVDNAIFPVGGDKASKTFSPSSAVIPAGQSLTVNADEPFADAKLWSPDSPFLYNVVTTLSINGKVVDVRDQKFGFREWTWSGDHFSLNGVPWHGRADLVDYGQADTDAVATWRKHGQDMVRMWGEDTFSGLSPEDALDFFDSHGVVVRRTGIFDGEAARYELTDGDHVRQELFDHWQAQLLAWAKGQRNHPSIFIWSIENEIAFINAKVYGLSSIVDPVERKVAARLQALDPTRPVMTDGGNALLDESMPVYGGHYMEPDFATLPGGAYDFAGFAHRQDWPITQAKPFIIGESFYASGNQPADFATIGGESAFLGKAESHPAIGLTAKMLSEGYRWNGVSFQFWIGGESDSYYNSWQPVAALCRQWDWSFASGQKVSRTVRIFNDSSVTSPITFKWLLQIGETISSSDTHVYDIAPGSSTTVDVNLPMPESNVRRSGNWKITLSQQGKTVFTDNKPLSVLPSARLESQPTPSKIALFDPNGAAAAFLKSIDVGYIPVKSLESAPPSAKVLLVGRDSLTTSQATSSWLSAYAASGRTVIVLEQNNPLKFQGLPAQTDSTTDRGEVGFMEDSENPIFDGLAQPDFFTWGPDGSLYKNAYLKSPTGGRSLLECGMRLADSALLEYTPGSGLMLLCQIRDEEKLSSSAASRRLLVNLIDYGLKYKQVYRTATVVAPDNKQLTDALDAIHLQYSKSTDILKAIDKPGSIAVIDATPANLTVLANNISIVDRFTKGGGWMILNNLTPEGIESYDKLVGVDHLIRPFHQEKVAFTAQRNHLTFGMSPDDIVMGNGQNIFGYEAGQYADQDAFSYVVDTGDIAPFSSSTFGSWDKITNGFTQADGFWPLIINFPAPADGKPFGIPIVFPRPETVTKITFVGNNNYWPQTKLNLNFGGSDNVSVSYNHGDTGSPALPQTYDITPPRTASGMTLQITGWDQLPNVADNIGIDNIYIGVKKTTDFDSRVHPMLNIGALVEYPRGAGGIVLCNVKYKDPSTEANPENTGKKQAIIAAILKNLNAQFSGAKTIIAGSTNLTYSSIDLKQKVNQYLNEQGWFGDKQFTFADFPNGRQVLAGVPYTIYNFTTSPVPTVVMLGGGNVPGNLPDNVSGIPVNQKADALFFLQAARIDQQISADDIRNHRKFEMADYVIHYADGTTEKAPIYSQVDVENYKQQAITAIPGAQIAWQKAYPGTNEFAVAYSMQWQNPHPDKVIQSIDLVYGPDRWRGIPCLIALTAATSK